MEIGKIFKGEVVTSIEAETTAASHLGGFHERLYRFLATGGIPAGITLGIELHTVGARPCGHLNHLRIGIDENAHADTAALEFLDHILQVILVLDRIPAGIAGQHPVGIGHQRHLRGTDFLHQINKTPNSKLRIPNPPGVPLYVELRSNDGLDVVDVLIADMPLVGTGMYGDALSTEALAIDSKLFHIGSVAATCIADGGHLVDIHT